MDDEAPRVRDLDEVPFVPQEVREYTGDAGVVSVREIEVRPAAQVALYTPRHRLSLQRDRVFFSFGPVYETVFIEDDLVDMFRVACGILREGDLERQRHAFPGEAIFPKLKSDWRFTLESIPRELAQDLIDWAQCQEFVRRSHGERWKIKAYWVRIKDPLRSTESLEVLAFLPRSLNPDENEAGR